MDMRRKKVLSLLPLESEEEWAMVEEVIGAFAEDEDEAQE